MKYSGVKAKNCCEGVTVSRRAARGGKVKVTQHDPKWLALLPMWFLSIMESSLTQEASRNSSQVQHLRCEYYLHTPSRHHHTCAVRPPRRRPGQPVSQSWATCHSNPEQARRTAVVSRAYMSKRSIAPDLQVNPEPKRSSPPIYGLGPSFLGKEVTGRPQALRGAVLP